METLPTGEHPIRLQYHCHRNWHSDSKIDKANRGTDDGRGYKSYASTHAHTIIVVSSAHFRLLLSLYFMISIFLVDFSTALDNGGK